MKRLFNKLKSAFLVLMTVVISLPLSSFTAGAMAQPLSVDNPACDETVASGNITLCKTAQPVPGMVNTWDITLKIKSKKVTTKSDTVLVIDRSGSMNSNGRMPAAKTAARSFVNTLLPAGNTTNRIALVSFAGEVQTNSNFTNNAATLISAIDGLNANGGTYTQAAIHQAQQLLASSTADYKTIVLLSDGEPTYSATLNNPDAYLIPYAGYGGQTGTGAPQEDYQYNSRVGSGSLMLWRYYDGWGNSNDKYYNHGNSTIAEAGFAKNAGGSTIYTVALQAGTQGNGVLNAVASPDSAYTANPDDLRQIFDEIAGKISNFIKDANVVDQMGAGVIVENGDKTLNWTPTFTQEGDFFVAEKTYRIQLDGTKLVDGWYDANQIAALTYNDGQTANFPVPKVDPTFVKIEKKLDGDDCANCEFTFELTLPTNVKEFHSVKLGEVKTLYHPMPVGNYSIVETSAKDAGGNAMSLDQYDVSIVPATFALSQAGADVAVLATNKLKTTDVSVRKQWTGKPGTSATVTLHADGVATSHSIELNAGNDWEHTFTGLRKHNRDGSLVKYTIVETPVAGYEASYSDDGLTVTNKYIPEKINITGKKVWTGGDNFNGGIRPDIKLQLKKNGVNEGDPVTLTHPNVEHPWTGLEETDINGNPHTYTVDEVSVPANYEKVSDGSTITVENKYVPSLTEVTATKKWSGGDNNLPRPNVELQLYQNSIAFGAKVILTHPNTTAIWKKVPLTDEQGNPYVYTVKEVSIPLGYEMDQTSEWVITNTYKPGTTSRTATKIWEGGPKPAVKLQLKQDGTAYRDPVELTTDSSSYTWSDLPQYSQSGKEFVYTVDEVEVPENYTATKSGDGFTITNTYVIPTSGSAEATKTWVNGPTPRPTVWFKLYRQITGGTVEEVPDAEIKELADGTLTVSWSNLEETDINGKPYTFSVKEVDKDGADFTPEHYSKNESDLKVTNTYASPKMNVLAEKIWQGGDETLPRPAITLQLYRNGVAMVGDDYKAVLTYPTVTKLWLDLDKTDTSGKDYVYTVKEESVPLGYEMEQTSEWKVTNLYKSNLISKTVTKVWEGGPKPDIKVQLKQDGEDYRTPVTLTGATTSYTWNDLPEYSQMGVAYTYTVDEAEVPENYAKSVDGFTITNTYTSPTDSFIATKTWDGGEALGDRPTVWFKLWRQVGTEAAEVVPGATIKALPHGVTEVIWDSIDTHRQADGEAYTFSVQEVNEDGDDFTPEHYIKKDRVGLSVTNNYKSPTANVTATKKWVDGSTVVKPIITLQLYRNDTPHLAPENVVTAMGENIASVTWENLDVTDHEGKPYVYTVKETSLAGPWQKSEVGLEVTNTYQIPKIDISVDKSWVGGKEVVPETITVNLLRDGTTLKSAELKSADGWSYTWTDLDETDIDGNKYEYMVKEVEMPNWEVDIAGDATEGFTITNSYVSPVANITVTKKWVDEFAEHPEIEVDLLRDGESFLIVGTMLNKDNDWSYTWEDVALTDPEGNPYEFTVREVTELDQYDRAITGTWEDGFLITNTWLTPGMGDVPMTGVGQTMSLLVALVGLFLVALGLRGLRLAKQIA